MTHDEIRQAIYACRSVAEAAERIEGLKLTAPELRALGKALGVFMGGHARKDDAVKWIARCTVGARLDTEAIHRI